MKKKNELKIAGAFLAAFSIWTILIMTVDVKPLGQKGTHIGLATINYLFHKATGVHMWLYTVTDWLGLVPVFVSLTFAGVGMAQLIKRRSLFKVDKDIMILGFYYVVVIAAYLLFEMIPINYRPILIGGRLEASYPSSTTLLVLCVMSTLIEQTNRRLKNTSVKTAIVIGTILFSIFMVLGRLISGVHWITDIIGSVLLSVGLFYMYKSIVSFMGKKKEES